MNVSPDRVVELVREGLAPALASDPDTVRLATELAREIAVYGVRAMPSAMMARPSGRPIAAAVCEDVETAALARPWLDGRCVEIAHGWGMVSVVLAARHPDRAFECVEDDRERRWFLRRLVALLGLRNLVVHETTPLAFASANQERCDLVFVKGLGATAALELAVPMLAPGGRVLTWQTGDASAEVRRPRTNPRGDTVRLLVDVRATSAPARGRHLLVLGAGTAALDATQPAA